jgi:hypothetical protein
MFLPDDELKVKVSHIDIRDGSIVVKIEIGLVTITHTMGLYRGVIQLL